MSQSEFFSPDVYTNKAGASVISNPFTGSGLSALRTNQSAILELPGALPEKTFPIVDGVITPTQAICIVDTEGGAPSDELTTMATTIIHDGAEVALRAADATRTATLVHGNQPGGLQLSGGVNRSLSSVAEARFRLRGGLWYEIPAIQTEATATVSLSPTPSTIPLRGPNGEIKAGAPRADGDAVTQGSTKDYSGAFPSTSYIIMTVPAADGSITMPFNGFLRMIANPTYIGNYPGPIGRFGFSDGFIEYLKDAIFYTGNSQFVTGFYRKGVIVKIMYYNTTPISLIAIKAVGEV